MDDKMTPAEAITSGKMIFCTKEEYKKIRKELHKYAAEQIDNGHAACAQIALMEISRLDGFLL